MPPTPGSGTPGTSHQLRARVRLVPATNFGLGSAWYQPPPLGLIAYVVSAFTGGGKKMFVQTDLYRYHIGRKGEHVSTQSNALHQEELVNTLAPARHDEQVALDGLEHIFRWASEVVADGEDARVKLAREKRVRRQVLEVVQKYREQKLLSKAADETAYLQRRVIALLQRLQEALEENSAIKHIMVNQYWQLARIPQLERELRDLRSVEFEREAAVTERRYLMDALARVKTERDYLDDLLAANERENSRLSGLLKETRAELEEQKARRWWHLFLPPKFGR